MIFMPWSQALAVGINEVDTQHRWLVDATNRLHDALQTPGTPRATVSEVLEGLMDYTMNHFIMEESLFEQHGYPDAVAHKAQHNHFTATLLRLLSSFEAGREIGPEVLALLRDWLLGHIMHSDKAYVPHLQAQLAPA